MTDVTVTASPALPKNVTPEDITLEAPKRIARNENGLSTAYLPDPTFSEPRILEHGKLIAFTLCVDASHVSAGSYVGQIVVGGPEGVQPASVTVTLTAKNQGLFTLGIILAALLAFALLALRSIRANWEALKADERSTSKAAFKSAKEFFGFWVPTLIAIGAAVVAMFQVYDANVAWGADTKASLIALGGTAISAAGLGAFLSSFKGS